jgi:hypothetical protein
MSNLNAKIIEKKYGELCKRTFNYRIELLLFDKILSEKEIEIDDISLFSQPIALVREEYRKACQLKSKDNLDNYTITMDELDKKMENWYKQKRNLKADLEKKFEDIFKNELPLKDFEVIYDMDRKCHYCGISIEQIEKLIENKSILTKRLLTRGRSFEVDKIDPNGDYSKDNIALCCYWCNNAKSDEYTSEEFKTIGVKIKEIWNKRIKEINLKYGCEIEEII